MSASSDPVELLKLRIFFAESRGDSVLCGIPEAALVMILDESRTLFELGKQLADIVLARSPEADKWQPLIADEVGFAVMLLGHLHEPARKKFFGNRLYDLHFSYFRRNQGPIFLAGRVLLSEIVDNLRVILCPKDNSKTGAPRTLDEETAHIRKMFSQPGFYRQGATAGIAAEIVSKLGIEDKGVATGVAVLALVVVFNAIRSAFCIVSSEAFLQEVDKHRPKRRRWPW